MDKTGHQGRPGGSWKFEFGRLGVSALGVCGFVAVTILGVLVFGWEIWVPGDTGGLPAEVRGALWVILRYVLPNASAVYCPTQKGGSRDHSRDSPAKLSASKHGLCKTEVQKPSNPNQHCYGKPSKPSNPTGQFLASSYFKLAQGGS